MFGLKRIATTSPKTTPAEKPLRTARAVVSAALVVSLAATPATALAAKQPSDRIVGKSLSSGEVSAKDAPNIDAAAGALVDQDGRVLWGRGASKPRAMASTTKMMTALLVLEHGKLDQKVRISRRASKTPYGIGLHAGEKMSVRHLLSLMLVCSSNDAAYALGEHVGGSMPRFVRMMNERAAELGLEDTHFKNPHGLDARGHYASPVDLAKISQQAMKHRAYQKAVLKRSVKLPRHKGRPARTIKATDKLLGRYAGLRGGKTGFTDDARYSFVASAKRGKIALTVVVLGTNSNDARFGQAAKLLDWGFKHSEVRALASAGEKAGAVKVAGTSTSVPVELAAPATARVFSMDGKIRREASLPRSVKLPVVAGQELGTVDLVQGDRVLATVPAVATKTMLSAEETVGAVPVSDYLDRRVTARAAKASDAPKLDPALPVTRTVELRDDVASPVARGDRLGEIQFRQRGEIVARVPVVATSDVAEPTIVETVRVSVARGLASIISGGAANAAR